MQTLNLTSHATCPLTNASSYPCQDHEHGNKLIVKDLLHFNDLNGLIEEGVAVVLALAVMIKHSERHDEIPRLQAGIWHKLIVQADLLSRCYGLMVHLRRSSNEDLEYGVRASYIHCAKINFRPCSSREMFLSR